MDVDGLGDNNGDNEEQYEEEPGDLDAFGKGGKGTLANKGKRRKRSPDDDDDDDYSFMPDTIDVQEQHVKKGGHGKIKNVHHKGSKNTGPIQKIGKQTQHVSNGAHGDIHNKLIHSTALSHTL